MFTQVETLTNTLRIELASPITDDRPIYLTGNFCKWLPDLEEYKLKQSAPGIYTFEFPTDFDFPEVLEYKYTRGSWDQVELDEFGTPRHNRYAYSHQHAIQDLATHWQQAPVNQLVDYSPIIEILSETFEIPQLNKQRKIHVLLPYDYYTKQDVHYPVLYMTDAQNLFGEHPDHDTWQIDKSLKELGEKYADIIIVAIDHGGAERTNEFSPYDNPNLGKGQGALFLKFIAETLKPQIDLQYRTKKDRLNTGIGGSSVGGLLSIYAGLMSPDIFGRMMIFSPSLWISKRIYFDAIHFFEPFETRIYIYAGGKESENMIENTNQLHETIKNQGFGYSRVKINTSIDLNGEHHEKRWGKEFPIALKWLFFEE
jgi:predicted alpha/beta superfamily hydrolase